MSGKTLQLVGITLLTSVALATGLASSAFATPASDANRPGPAETGYTNCWETHPELTDLDPYDARTWPDGEACFPGQDYRPQFTGTVTASNDTSGVTITRTLDREWSGYQDQIIANGPETIELQPGQTAIIDYTLTFGFPEFDTTPVIGLDGTPRGKVAYTTEFRTTAPWIEPETPGLQTELVCDDISLDDVNGQAVTVNCELVASLDTDADLATLPDRITLQLIDPYEARRVDPSVSTDWLLVGTWDGLPITLDLLPAGSETPADPPALEEPNEEPQPELAATGIEAGIVAPLALGLISVGSALLLTRRRRST